LQSLQFADTGHAPMPLIDPAGDKRALQAIAAPFVNGGDHPGSSDSSFGVPVVYIGDWPDRYIHTNKDRAENIDPTKMKRAMFIAAASAYYLANLTSRDVPSLWSEIREHMLTRVSTNLARANALADRGEAGNLWRFHF